MPKEGTGLESSLELALKSREIDISGVKPKVDPIAVIGIGCRFPGNIENPNQYWEFLKNRKNAIVDVPPDRWDIDEYYDPDVEAPGKTVMRRGGFIDSPHGLDAKLFRISPREARMMDPQQKFLLETCWAAMEDAGVFEGVEGSRTGVFVGMGNRDEVVNIYRGDLDGISFHSEIGSNTSIASGRVAYCFDMEGPAVSLDTACSSSLVAIHLACQSLHTGDSAVAIAGGVNSILIPEIPIALSHGKVLSPDGQCKTFDASANGFVRSEGCGLVVLKRLVSALEDGDQIQGIIRGSAINQDGMSTGMTAPSRKAQAGVYRNALENAGIAPEQVQYIECHGTGTPLGDPTEVKGLNDVYGESCGRENSLYLGSVKANIGHLETCAGVAGLIKAVLVLKYKQIPGNIHLKSPNPNINWERFPIVVPKETVAWPEGEGIRFCGVSSFGFSGTNAHVILEEVPDIPEVEKDCYDRGSHALALSAMDEKALEEHVERFIQHFDGDSNANFGDVCFSANTGRRHFAKRFCVVGETLEEINTGLKRRLEDWRRADRGNASEEKSSSPLAFLYTGQGAQYPGMTKELYKTCPVFRNAMNACADGLEPICDFSLIDRLFGNSVMDASGIKQTSFLQPAMFAIQYSLSMLWQSWGIEPDYVLGHSVGEVAAACTAGVMCLEDALSLIGERAKLMEEFSVPGKMLAVWSAENIVRSIVSDEKGVAIAVINGPEMVVVSGESDGIDRIALRLSDLKISSRILDVSHAFHSPLMDPVLLPFDKSINYIHFNNPRIPIVADSTGALDREAIATPGYWVEHIRKPVRFYDGMRTLFDAGCRDFLEIGPQRTLLELGKQMGFSGNINWMSSLQRDQSDWRSILESLSTLYENGAAVNWSCFEEPYRKLRKKTSLPTYPFQRKIYRDIVRDRPAINWKKGGHPLLGHRILLAGETNVYFENELSLVRQRYIGDHVLLDKVVVPGTAYLEMMVSAVKSVLGEICPFRLQEVTFKNPIFLEEESVKTIQCIVSELVDGVREVSIHCLEGDNPHSPSWITIAQGCYRDVKSCIEEPFVDLVKWQAECSTEISKNEFYANARKLGFYFGPGFHGIQRLFYGADALYAEIHIPDCLVGEMDRYTLHPALLDSCLQVAIQHIYLTQDTTDSMFLPIAIEQVSVLSEFPASVVCCMRPNPNIDNDVLSFQVRVCDVEGNLIVSIDELTVRRRSTVFGWDSSVPLLGVSWKELTGNGVLGSACKRFLVLAWDGEEANEIGAHLEEDGKTVIKKTFFDELSVSLFDSTDSTGIVFYCSPPKGRLDPVRMSGELCRQCLEHIQFLLSYNLGQFVCFVTKGAAQYDHFLSTAGLVQHSILGMARTFACEHPERIIGMVDLSSIPTRSEWNQLANMLVESEGIAGKEIAIRENKRYLRCFTQCTDLPSNAFQRLEVDRVKGIEGLHLKQLSAVLPKPASGEVEIEIRASGTNFRDVLNALDMYPGDAGLLGGECAGVVVSLPDGVANEFNLGDKVIAAKWGSFTNRICVKKEAVSRMPVGISFAEAATIPSVFLTAYYSLVKKAKIGAGSRVLIHAAAGGVGLAAIQIAKNAGAEIYATASKQKWAFLKTLGVEHVMDSRALGFSGKVEALTQGEGVDVILNSLSGEFIQESVSILKRNGVFLELGKRGILEPDAFCKIKPEASYHIIDLYRLAIEMPELQGEMLREIVCLFDAGELKPLPRTVFPLERAKSAFTFMQRGRHIGKIVMTPPDRALEFSGSGTYLITGGLGGLGLQVVEWLLGKGVRSIVLISRNAPKGEGIRYLEKLQSEGITIEHFAADVSNRDELAKAMKQIVSKFSPLVGVFHLAGVLDDGVITQQTAKRLEAVMQPKIAGTWNLHELTLDYPLEMFVLFSSIASSIGSPGQINYAAANAFEDAFASYRRGLGLSANAINWPAWDTAGMAEGKVSRANEIFKIQPDVAFAALEKILQLNSVQVNVVPFSQRSFRPDSAYWKNLFSGLLNNVECSAACEDGVRIEKDIREIINEVDPDARSALMLQYMVGVVSDVVEADDVGSIDTQSSLIGLGLDSLMATQFRNRIAADCEVSVSVSTVMGRISLEEMAEQILKKMEASAR